MTVETPRVLLISESRITRRVVEMTLADQAVELVTAGSTQDGLAAWHDTAASIVLADLSNDAPSDGLALARHVHDGSDGRPVAVILMAGQHELVDDDEMAAAGVRAVLRKPLDSMELLDAVRGALRAETPATAPWPPSAVAVVEPAPFDMLPPFALSDLLAIPEPHTMQESIEMPEPLDMTPLASFTTLAAEAPVVAPLADADLERVAARVAAIWSGQSAHEQRVAELVAARAEQAVAASAVAAAERVAPEATSAAAERLVRELAPALVAEVARLVVADVSERLVREEIARMRAEHAR